MQILNFQDERTPLAATGAKLPEGCEEVIFDHVRRQLHQWCCFALSRPKMEQIGGLICWVHPNRSKQPRHLVELRLSAIGGCDAAGMTQEVSHRQLRRGLTIRETLALNISVRTPSQATAERIHQP